MSRSYMTRSKINLKETKKPNWRKSSFWFENECITVAIVGPQGGGKSAFIERHLFGEFNILPQYTPPRIEKIDKCPFKFCEISVEQISQLKPDCVFLMSKYVDQDFFDFYSKVLEQTTVPIIGCITHAELPNQLKLLPNLLKVQKNPLDLKLFRGNERVRSSDQLVLISNRSNWNIFKPLEYAQRVVCKD